MDTRQDPELARQLRTTWTREATRRMERGCAGSFGFSLFAVSAQGTRALRDLHLEYVHAMQAIIAGSQTNDCVGLYCGQLLDLDEGESNALSGHVGAGLSGAG